MMVKKVLGACVKDMPELCATDWQVFDRQDIQAKEWNTIPFVHLTSSLDKKEKDTICLGKKPFQGIPHNP